MKKDLNGVRLFFATLFLFVGLVATRAQSGQAWPPGAREILKLELANVGDDTIIAYIKNTGRQYHLNTGEIIMLSQQGFSDQVLTAMMQNHPQPEPSQSELQSNYGGPPADVAAGPADSPFGYVPPISLSFGWSSGGSYDYGHDWHGGSYHHGDGGHGGGSHGDGNPHGGSGAPHGGPSGGGSPHGGSGAPHAGPSGGGSPHGGSGAPHAGPSGGVGPHGSPARSGGSHH